MFPFNINGYPPKAFGDDIKCVIMDYCGFDFTLVYHAETNCAQEYRDEYDRIFLQKPLHILYDKMTPETPEMLKSTKSKSLSPVYDTMQSSKMEISTPKSQTSSIMIEDNSPKSVNTPKHCNFSHENTLIVDNIEENMFCNIMNGVHIPTYYTKNKHSDEALLTLIGHLENMIGKSNSIYDDKSHRRFIFGT